MADLTAERRSGKVLTVEADNVTLEELRRRDWEQAGLSGRTVEETLEVVRDGGLTTETVDDPDESPLAAEDYAGVPLAYGYQPGRSMVSEPMAGGFSAFSRGAEASGTVDRSEAARKLGQLLQEGQRRRQLVDENGDDVAGVPLAVGF